MTKTGRSLSAAARALNSTQPTLGRQVTALEEALGVTLFERAGRSFQMTSAGHDLLEHVQAMGAAASRISMVASGQSQDVAGRVTITASELMAAGFLPPVMRKLRHRRKRRRDKLAGIDVGPDPEADEPTPDEAAKAIQARLRGQSII